MLSWNELQALKSMDVKEMTDEQLLLGICEFKKFRGWDTVQKFERERTRRANKEQNRIMVNGLNDYPHAE
jgi:hypothetical protein